MFETKQKKKIVTTAANIKGHGSGTVQLGALVT
jgi:hypothetical protein